MLPAEGLRRGPAEVLGGEAPLEQAVRRVEGVALEVLQVRGLPPNPSELLASDSMRRLLETLASRYDRVILDLPPTPRPARREDGQRAV